MKIEKVSENQLRMTLDHQDLLDRGLQLEDLIKPSDRTQALFRDIMEQALEQYDFISENTPLMVEAVPAGVDGITIIVTKIDQKDHATEASKLGPQSREQRRFKKKPMEQIDREQAAGNAMLIYSFAGLDDVIDVCLRLDEEYHGASALYKNNGRYFLILQSDAAVAGDETEDLESVLNEYGQKHVSNILSKYYLVEHGETLIENKAVKTLAKNFS